MEEPKALVLTLKMDEKAFHFFDGQRSAYFPPEINYLPAHISLFHRLPGEEQSAIKRELEAVCAEFSAFPVNVGGLRHLGRGVAYLLESEELLSLHRKLRARFTSWLTAQDQQSFRPHITVQNKVDPQEARKLLRKLETQFGAFEFVAEGVLLWRYLGGPWEPVQEFRFDAL